MRRSRASAGALAVLTACAAAPRSQPVPLAVPRNDIRWVRASAEYRGIAIEIYRDAADHLPELTRGLPRASWAVILDADETVLDNSLHERRDADAHEQFTDSGWTGWVHQAAATAVPGAVDFVRQVHALGGRVAIVTNRADSLCAITRDNLAQVGIAADIVLCEPPHGADKNARFEAIEQGRTAAGGPALTVVEWIGDNIQDFPHLTQAVRTETGGYAEFGRRYFLLPNPMYGSWEHNPEP